MEKADNEQTHPRMSRCRLCKRICFCSRFLYSEVCRPLVCNRDNSPDKLAHTHTDTLAQCASLLFATVR